jgi:hypothetical protein
MDEGFELLTLMQTGASPIAPVVLLDEPGAATGRRGSSSSAPSWVAGA